MSTDHCAIDAYLSPMTKTDAQTRVLYNADCPVCRREIAHYERVSNEAALPIRYDPLGNADRLADWGVTADAAARRLHVFKDGQIYDGVAAFEVLWADIPRYRWLARSIALPAVRPVATALYDHVLAPLLYRSHLRRDRRHAARASR